MPTLGALEAAFLHRLMFMPGAFGHSVSPVVAPTLLDTSRIAEGTLL
jgi:hypothetical protein